MILYRGSKLIAHLCGHEGVCDVILLKVVVQFNEVEPNLFWDDVYRSSAGQCRIHIHHTGIKAIAGVCRNLAFGL